MRTPRPEPYYNVQTVASGAVYVIGPDGDDDPQHALEQVTISNTGSTVLRVAADLTGVQGSRHILLANGLAPVTLVGPFNSLVIKTNTAASSTFSLAAQCYYRNAGLDGGVKDSQDTTGRTRRRPGRLSFVANATTTTNVTLRSRATISTIKLYAGAAPATGAITLAIADSKGRNLLAASTFDLTSLVGGTLTALTLTASTDLLTVPAGETLTFTIVSDNGGATCATAFEVSYTEA